MYPMPTPQIPAYAPGASLLSRGMLQGGTGHLSQLPIQQGVMGQSGGFLSKLIGGAKAGGGGITNIMNMLQNAQKTIGTIQSFGPMVQQYTPLVKSLPSLIGAMKGSGNTDDKETDKKAVKKMSPSNEVSQKSATKTQPKKEVSTKKKQSKKKSKKTKKNSTAEISKGIPAPKLYI